jgi:hypothetical protein
MNAATLSGAQTERRGEAGLVRIQLGGETHRPIYLSHVPRLTQPWHDLALQAQQGNNPQT